MSNHVHHTHTKTHLSFHTFQTKLLNCSVLCCTLRPTYWTGFRVKKDTARLIQSFRIRPIHSCTVLTLLATSDHWTTTSRSHYSVKCQYWFAYPLESKRMWQGSVKASELDPITPVLCSLDWLPVTTRLQDHDLITLLCVSIGLLTLWSQKGHCKAQSKLQN